MNWDKFNTFSAEERIEAWDSASEKFTVSKDSPALCKTQSLTDTDIFVIGNLFGADSHYCDCCERQLPDLMMFECDDESLKTSPEYAAIMSMNVEYQVCAWCIADAKEDKCVKCSVGLWAKDRLCKKWVDGKLIYSKHEFVSFEERYPTELLIQKRNLALQELNRFTGLPTLEYDEIIEKLESEIIGIEHQLVSTCAGCGGEIIPNEIDKLHYEPENGLCAKELDSCEVSE